MQRAHVLPIAALVAGIAISHAVHAQAPHQPHLGARSAPTVQRDGLHFKDLNRNGTLDPYEDWRLSPDVRARDLVGRMTLAEKAGAMVHGTARVATGDPSTPGAGGTRYDTTAAIASIRGTGINSLITRLSGDPRVMAEESNTLQAIAESTRLGIPVTISTDPRNSFQYVFGASERAGRFSQWPEALGLAAVGDPALVRRFADIARREYRAVGITMALSPQADLATEPRWSRITGTFGEDAELARKLVQAYVEGFQHGSGGVDSAGVVTVVKHWVGYGAQKNGFDSHNYYGRFASMPGTSIAYHVTPFLGAFAAHAAGIMPTYSILEGATLDGQPVEQVGAGFNKQLLTDLLRTKYRFDGVVISDWGITGDWSETCRNGAASGAPRAAPGNGGSGMSWGVESLSKAERFGRAITAGVDQIGGTEEAQYVVDAVNAGKLTPERVDEAVFRIVRQKFQLGLFENPYVDPARAAAIVGNPDFRAQALDAQRRALVLLENKDAVLPLKPSVKKMYLYHVDSTVAARYGFTVVADPAQADVAIVRTTAPFESLHPGYGFGARQHEGSLAFHDGDAEYETIKRIMAAVPTIVTVFLDRPAILTPFKAQAKALIGNFGVSDDPLFDVLTGKAKPEGTLPFELPSSMQAVEAQRSDLPHDSTRPLYPFGFGRRF